MLYCASKAPIPAGYGLVDRYRNQHRLADNRTRLTYLLAAGVEDHVRVALIEASLGKRLQTLFERLVDHADR